MPPPKIPPVVSDINLLTPQMKERVVALLSDVVTDRLPLRVFETLRRIERQEWLFAKGYSKAKGANGPHPWGLAVDIILNPKSPEWKEIGDRPTAIGGGVEWDTGYNQTADGLVLVRPGVAHVVRSLGELAKKHGLEWGGVNAGGWLNGAKGAEFGWDPFHLQLANWRAWTKHLPAPSRQA